MPDETLPGVHSPFPIYRLLASVLLVITVLVVRTLVRRWVTRSLRISPDQRRVWLTHNRNFAFVSVLIGLIVVWAPQIHSVAISVFAVAAAIVIATKELIMCVSGAVLKTGAGSFSIGDRIEIMGHRGDVIDQRLLSTTMFEIGPGQTTHQYTGRLLVIPNSVFLNNVVINETYSDQYVLHGFTIPLDRTPQWRESEALLLQIAHDNCRSFIEEAREHMAATAEREGLKPPSVEPRVTVQLPDPDHLNFVVRIPAPVRERGRVEQSIVRAFLTRSVEESEDESKVPQEE